MALDFQKWYDETKHIRPRRRSTKWIVGSWLAVLVSAAIMFPIIGAKPAHFDRLIAIPLCMILFVSPPYFPIGSRVWVNKSKDRFDEFALRARSKAESIAFRITATLAALLCFWCQLGKTLNWPIPNESFHWSLWAWTFVSLALYLPILIAEIIIPMPPKGEMGDEE